MWGTTHICGAGLSHPFADIRMVVTLVVLVVNRLTPDILLCLWSAGNDMWCRSYSYMCTYSSCVPGEWSGSLLFLEQMRVNMLYICMYVL